MNEIKAKNMKQLSEYIQYLRQNPKLTYLFIELTDKCNLACIHCGSSCEVVKGQFIDTDCLIHALQTIEEDFDSRAVMVCLTGGEPMLHPDFYKIVHKIVELGFAWGMTTNGTFIDRQNAEKLKKYKMGSITISLDGLKEMHEWFRNTSGSFQKVIDAICNLQNVNIPVQVTTVIHKKNIHQLEEMYKLINQLGVISWRIINLEPIGRAKDRKDLALSYDEFIQMLEYIREKRFSADVKFDVRYGCSHYLSFEYEHEVRDNYFICGSGLYVGSILCNGDIYSCLDIERRAELVQGNINKDRFSKIWFDKFKEFRENRTIKSKKCSSCLEKEFCNGDSTHTWDFDKNEPLFCLLKGEI